MVKRIHRIWLLVLLSFMMGYNSISAQNGEEYTPKKSLEYFNDGDYKNAELAYSYLVNKYPKDASYNFYLGICKIKNKRDLSDAIKMLNYAKIKRVSRNVYYYLGRAHHLSFHFDEAISNFNKFLEGAKKGDNKVEKTQLYLEQCKNGRKMASKIYNLSVIDRSVSHTRDILEMYYPAKDVGRLLKNGDFFESGVNPNHVMFETERGDVVYFSMAANSEDTLSIYKMEKLLDGWGDSKDIGTPVNSIYNDAYPFLATDGLTLYFSSDRPGGFGGYDIYKIYFDNETQSFLEPINMGVPFNSSGDDYLFVSDQFNQVAWFASNRETTGDSVMIYTVKWDGNQVRNMVDDVNQITQAAKLLVEEGDGEGADSEDSTYGHKRKRTKTNQLFSFTINDTIVYTHFDHFINEEALQLFRQGFESNQKRDSLSKLMKSKRREYSVVNNEEERSKIVNEILTLENRVYSLDDQIEEKYLYARQKELHEIQNRINDGTYSASRQVKSNKPNVLNFDGIFIPEKYTFHTSDEFQRNFAKQESMYKQLFSDNDIKTLRSADSLYVWANIINLESSRLLEESTQVEEEQKLKLGQLIKKSDSLKDQEEEPNSTRLIKESKELKILSTRIYHKAFDKKFPIYYLKLKDITRKLGAEKSEGVASLFQQGNAHFREAKNVMNGLGGLNIETYEKAGALKKEGIRKQEEALSLYCSMDDLGDETEVKSGSDKVSGVVQKSYAELHRGEEVINKQKVEEKKEHQKIEKPKSSEVEKVINEVYKVQIGVFRNPPNKEALEKIPEVTKVELEGRGLTKYFSGKFKTYEEAQAAVSTIVNAGFTGAFVVFFKDGKISSVTNK